MPARGAGTVTSEEPVWPGWGHGGGSFSAAVVSLTSCFVVFLLFFWLFSLKLECDKLASEKSEMQRHYVMVRTGPGGAGVRVGAPVLPSRHGAAGLSARLKLAFLKAGLFHVILAGRVTVCLPGDEDEPFSRGIPGKAVLCAFPIKELRGGCDTVHKDELVSACQLLHLP